MSDTQVGQSDHDKAMIAKADAAAGRAAPAGGQPDPTAGKPDAAAAHANGGDPAQKPQRPDHVPEKFWDAEKGEVNMAALLKSYTELEKARSQPQKPDGEPKDPAQDDKKSEKVDPPAPVPAEAFQKYSQEFAEKGELSEDTYKELASKHGLPKEVVDSYIAGQVALASSAEARAYAAVGGAETYSKMIEWAGANLTPSEVAAFDKGVTGSEEQAMLAIQGLHARFVSANGQEPRGRVGGSGNAGSVVGYQSKAEMTADMRDPRYSRDPAYREMVQRKVANAGPGVF